MAIFDDVLLTVDFDRTFSACDSTVPQRNLDAVEFFMAAGGTFTINTGRSAVNFAKHLEDTPVNAPFLLYNGSAAYYKGQLSQCVEIDVDVWEMIDLLHSSITTDFGIAWGNSLKNIPHVFRDCEVLNAGTIGRRVTEWQNALTELAGKLELYIHGGAEE